MCKVSVNDRAKSWVELTLYRYINDFLTERREKKCKIQIGQKISCIIVYDNIITLSSLGDTPGNGAGSHDPSLGAHYQFIYSSVCFDVLSCCLANASSRDSGEGVSL